MAADLLLPRAGTNLAGFGVPAPNEGHSGELISGEQGGGGEKKKRKKR